MGLDFGDPNQIQIVPPVYLGQKKKNGGFLSKWFGGRKDLPQDPAEVAKHEHPMAVNMTSSLEEFAKKDPANITTADDKGFTMLHQLALAGAAKGVAILLRHGANPKAVAKNGMTPVMLAKALGWKDVVAVLEGK